MDLIITLKDDTEHKMRIYRLRHCGINQQIFFIESDKEGRIEFPINSLDGFRIDRPKKLSIAAEEGDEVVLNAAIISLSHFLS